RRCRQVARRGAARRSGVRRWDRCAHPAGQAPRRRGRPRRSRLTSSARRCFLSVSSSPRTLGTRFYGVPNDAAGGDLMLDERKLEVLRAIVEDFVSTNEPVGSKHLVEKHSLGVSPATIRNDMSALEDEGY